MTQYDKSLESKKVNKYAMDSLVDSFFRFDKSSLLGFALCRTQKELHRRVPVVHDQPCGTKDSPGP